MAGNVVSIVVTAVDNASREIDRIGDSAKKMQTAVAVGATAALAAMGAFSAAAIKAASDLGESQNAMRVTFGDSAKLVDDFAKTSAQAYGVSTREANQYTAALGGIAKGAGLSQQAAAEMSISVLKLAADTGSFKNLSLDVALEKIRSGLVGEVEPLRTLGVSFTAATVEAKAMEMGLAAYGDELTEGQKVMARWQLIQEGLSDAAGDFGETLGTSLPNQLKASRAELENTIAQMGTALLPVAIAAAKAINELVQAFASMPVPLQLTLLGVSAFTAAAVVITATVLPAMGAITGMTTALWGMNAALIANPVVLLAMAAALATVGLGFVAFSSLAEHAAEAGTTFSHTADAAMKQGAEAARETLADYELLRAELVKDIETFQAAGRDTSDLENTVADLDTQIDELRRSLAPATDGIGAMSGAMETAEEATRRLEAAQKDLKKALDDVARAEANKRAEFDKMFGTPDEGAGLGAPGDFPGFTGVDAVKHLQEESRRIAQANEEAAASAKRAASEATKALTEAEKELEAVRRETAQAIGDINRQLLDDQIKAYEEGGMAQLESVKGTQAAMMEQVRAKATELQSIWGLQFPDALTRAFGIVKSGIDAISESAKQLQSYGIGLINSFNQQGVKSYGPGVFETIAKFGGLNVPQFATGGIVPGPTGAPTLAVVHGGEQVIPVGGGAGAVYNITINAPSGDASAIGQTLIDYINAATRRNGAGLINGAVQA